MSLVSMLPMLSKGQGTDAQKPRYWGMTQGRICLQGKQFFNVLFTEFSELNVWFYNNSANILALFSHQKNIIPFEISKGIN